MTLVAGQMHLALAVATATAATLGADVLWYVLGRSHGARVLGTLCRFSLDPDSFIRDAKEQFVAHRVRYIVLAKFLPGLNPLAAGLAGVVPIRPDRFLPHAATGSLLWAGASITLGYLFADVIGLVAARAARLGMPLALVIATLLMVYLAFKYVRRQRFLNHLQKARITPVELKRRLDAMDRAVPDHHGGHERDRVRFSGRSSVAVPRDRRSFAGRARRSSPRSLLSPQRRLALGLCRVRCPCVVFQHVCRGHPGVPEDFCLESDRAPAERTAIPGSPAGRAGALRRAHRRRGATIPGRTVRPRLISLAREP